MSPEQVDKGVKYTKKSIIPDLHFTAACMEMIHKTSAALMKAAFSCYLYFFHGYKSITTEQVTDYSRQMQQTFYTCIFQPYDYSFGKPLRVSFNESSWQRLASVSAKWQHI